MSMKIFRGTHTTLIPLAKEIVESLYRKNKNLEVSPSYIEAGIKAKTRNVTINLENNKVIRLQVISPNSKQVLRLYNSNLKEVKKCLDDMGIINKERELSTKFLK